YLSLNVQSLLSKHEQLSIEISELELNNVTIDAIALQETWDVKYTDLVPINGFNPLIFKRRRDMRGGGVGFYIRNGLTAEIVENLSPFENKIIEALTIKLTYPDSKVTYLTSIYRSNGTLANVTATQQLDRFMEKFATLLTDLQALHKVSFVFLDANINLLRLQLPDPSLYFNCILEKGFLQIISKATRMQ
ncbi:MAG: endonuclease/exonuclease/phosphatase family protein, partial [bacterium]